MQLSKNEALLIKLPTCLLIRKYPYSIPTYLLTRYLLSHAGSTAPRPVQDRNARVSSSHHVTDRRTIFKMKLTLRPTALTTLAPQLRPLLHIHRSYATHSGPSANSSAASKRKAVTPFNDDGHVPWRDLSVGEKTARATQQTFNFGLVAVGFVLTVSLHPVSLESPNGAIAKRDH